MSRGRLLLLLLSLCVFITSASVLPRHGDNEVSHSNPSGTLIHPGPLLKLDEAQVLDSHGPDPLSYWIQDWELSAEETKENYRGLIILHILGCMTAFFGLLPAGIALRSVKHRWHPTVLLAFNLVALFSAVIGSLYKKLAGDLYDGSTHGRVGYLTLWFAGFLALFDAWAFVKRAYSFLKSPQRMNIRAFWRAVVLDQQGYVGAEYTSLVHEEPSEYEQVKFVNHSEETSSHPSMESMRVPSTEFVNESHEDWPKSAATHGRFHMRHQSSVSSHSDDTLHPPGILSHSDSQDEPERRKSYLQSIGHYAFAAAERSLVFAGFVQVLSGISVYSGICRGNYLNGCMAHLIKGGIFWCYGLLSFGRYLGAWADFGWAWNRLPPRYASKTVSAEFVESTVIFVYGATNMWMERFGAEPGSPFTTKQIQHISIAVMFFFAGMLGMALESKAFRRWLAARATSVVNSDEHVSPPPSYAGSFNPFPALVIGVTGAAMSAHHQTYKFQVDIHALWGFFLTGFAVLRCLTYFFLWLRPPHSVLPSRPPTEAVSSFFLACGGLTFMLSTEQISFAAMRRGMDDMMFFFNFAVAVTCLGLCWVMSVVAFKGWINCHPQILSPMRRKILFDAHTA